MKFKLEIDKTGVDCIVNGSSKDMDKHISLCMTQYPQVRELLRRAIELSDRIEVDSPDLCEAMRSQVKENGDIFEENDNWKEAFKKGL